VVEKDYALSCLLAGIAHVEALRAGLPTPNLHRIPITVIRLRKSQKHSPPTVLRRFQVALAFEILGRRLPKSNLTRKAGLLTLYLHRIPITVY
jgi:hypothetical protein